MLYFESAIPVKSSDSNETLSPAAQANLNVHILISHAHTYERPIQMNKLSSAVAKFEYSDLNRASLTFPDPDQFASSLTTVLKEKAILTWRPLPYISIY